MNHTHHLGDTLFLMPHILLRYDRISSSKPISLGLETNFLFVHVHEPTFSPWHSATEHISKSNWGKFVYFLVGVLLVQLEVLGFGKLDAQEVLLLLGVG